MRPTVEIRVGSDSDLPRIEPLFRTLEDLQVPFEARVLSAHRTPERTAARTRELEAAGIRVAIAAAGGAAHLAGVTAAETLIPVIGIPVETSPLKGIDSLYSTIQMPDGIPVGAVGVAQAEHAGLLAARILALVDSDLRAKLRGRRGLPSLDVAPRDVVALIGRAEQASRDAAQLLAELGMKDCPVFEASGAVDAERSGAKAMIVWAEGDAFDLPGRIAAQTEVPVIGVPLITGAAPPDIFGRLLQKGPVAGVGTNRIRNAALFAAAIVATTATEVRERLRTYRRSLSAEVERKDAMLLSVGIRKYLEGMK